VTFAKRQEARHLAIKAASPGSLENGVSSG